MWVKLGIVNVSRQLSGGPSFVHDALIYRTDSAAVFAQDADDSIFVASAAYTVVSLSHLVTEYPKDLLTYSTRFPVFGSVCFFFFFFRNHERLLVYVCSLSVFN